MRPLKLTAALALGTCLAAPLAAQTTPQTTETAPMELSFERVFASPDLDGPSPRKVKVSPDGRYLIPPEDVVFEIKYPSVDITGEVI